MRRSFRLTSLAICALILLAGSGCRKVPAQWTAERPCTEQVKQELMIQCQPGQQIQPGHSWVYYWLLLNSGGPGRTRVTYNVYTPPPPPSQIREVPSTPRTPTSQSPTPQTGSRWWTAPAPTSPRTTGGFSRPTTPAPTYRAPSTSPRTSGGFSSSRPSSSPRTSGGFSKRK